MSNSYSNIVFALARRLLIDPKYAWMLACLVVLGDAVLTELIIRFVGYTEIDWETYMYHMELYLGGERNYTAVTGPTGPLVYPAGHVYIHENLYKLTSSGLNIPLAQHIYAVLYVASLALTCGIYLQSGGIPNWVLLILPLSKRLHSIYVLRLFNDCWATVGTQAGILALTSGYYTMSCIFFSLAVSVKMSALLYLPGLLIILWQQRGVVQTILHVVVMVMFQAILAWEFLAEYPWQYLTGAFDLSRVFLFKWTVNWRFLGEDTFLNPVWARTLLLCHLCTLLLFAHFKWCRSGGGILKLLAKTLRNPWAPARHLSADYVTTVLMTSNLIGITFARSLHYQFYSWYAQQIPFLIWRTRYPLLVKLAVIGSIEYAWNVFPSTNLSSTVLVLANVFFLTGVWFGWPTGRDVEHQTIKKSE
ncbi:glycosyltransferase family 58 protein [Fomitiporia mediterranea MF3/22]|uniref:glycosyltransferase family 58 protein n=1 Tax=Fomitiporia mediterranea (strain MF3/22) TaxID=694068 RepID=UPI000440848D|nr:glycosyltransferase family 58 protein [Fomitiporia mediterranea MF3/22]EJD05844.1 glycosyltransferase family 58 protein [Fomitiporia mediterranea MF3/22]